MSHVLFVCIQNAGRSQIAEALFTRAASDADEARSAGSRPAAHVHPEVVDAMRGARHRRVAEQCRTGSTTTT